VEGPGKSRDTQFVNIVTFDAAGSAMWVVENMYASAQNDCGESRATSSPRSRFFRLETQQRGAKRLTAVVVASSYPAPLTSDILREIASLPPSTFNLSPISINAEGHIPDSTTARPPGDVGPPPRPLEPWTRDPPTTTDIVAPKCRFQEDSPNVQCAINQCVPMAVANTLQYLEDQYDSGPFFTWELKDDLIRRDTE